MNTFTIEVENLKCGGCANTIRKSLETLEGVAGVTVDSEIKTVSFDSEESVKDIVLAKLKSLGLSRKRHHARTGIRRCHGKVICKLRNRPHDLIGWRFSKSPQDRIAACDMRRFLL